MTPSNNSPLPAPLDGESSKAYAAFAAYCQMGPARSLDGVGQSLGKSATFLSRWSTQHQWQERARYYDTAMARAAALARQQQYVADVLAHQQRYAEAGRHLHDTAMAMLDRLRAKQDKLTFTPATLSIIVKAFETAKELEAHGLLLEKLMEVLSESK